MSATPRPQSVRGICLQSVAECAGVPATTDVMVHLSPRKASRPGVTGVTLDSRAVRPGDLYAALPGANVHGARFVGAAIGLGAVAVLTDPAGAALLALREVPVPVLVVAEPRAVLGEVAALIYGRASRELTMLGITGTNGKTTTAYLLDSALHALGAVTGLIGTVETRIGQETIKSVRTTPESADLHALFAVMLERGVGTCTMEVSSHALTLHRVDGVRFDVAAFTNLSQDHLDFHGSMEEYFQAKASLFTPERAVRAVVCVDDEWGQRLVRESRVPVVSISSLPDVPADWQIHTTGLDASAFDLVAGDRRMSLRSALAGDFNRVNTAVAALVLLGSGYPPDAIEAALAADPHVPGRMERVQVGGARTAGSAEPVGGPASDVMPLAVVDFAHTPVAVASALKALRHSTSGLLIVVLGAGGDRDSGKRAAMGAAAAAGADVVIVTDDNPRSEDPATIRAAVVAGALGEQDPVRPSPSRIREIGDRGTAIREAVARAGPGDTVVVLGKGHESGQETAGVVHPFDDRAQLRAALTERAASMTQTASMNHSATSDQPATRDQPASGEHR
ncbi:MAG TPA: UDP-N-acetylmuramoyl-L-alanyl-D-glutamate--2,6-diaminopimelate ligase [Dermatophilaceae bacterium]